MTKDQLWNVFIQRNPQFLTGPINFKPESLKKFFNQVWEQAEKETKSKQPPNPPSCGGTNGFMDALSSDFFGGFVKK